MQKIMSFKLGIYSLEGTLTVLCEFVAVLMAVFAVKRTTKICKNLLICIM